MASTQETLAQLQEYLRKTPPGPVADSDTLSCLLANAWDGLQGSNDTRMSGCKLYRAEDLRWEPPLLRFRIERHGGTVAGSSRAELYEWSVNVGTGEAACSRSGHRQLRAMNKPLKVAPIAAELAILIRDGTEDPRLEWRHNGGVRVLISKIVPDTAPQQTVTGRRQRLRWALQRELGTDWSVSTRWMCEPTG